MQKRSITFKLRGTVSQSTCYTKPSRSAVCFIVKVGSSISCNPDVACCFIFEINIFHMVNIYCIRGLMKRHAHSWVLNVLFWGDFIMFIFLSCISVYFYGHQRAQPEELEKIRKHYETSDEEHVRLLDKPEQWVTSEINNISTLDIKHEHHVIDYETTGTVATWWLFHSTAIHIGTRGTVNMPSPFVRNDPFCFPDAFKISILNVQLHSQIFSAHSVGWNCEIQYNIIILCINSSRFLYELSLIPQFSLRARCIILQSTFTDAVASIQRKANTVLHVCKVQCSFQWYYW